MDILPLVLSEEIALGIPSESLEYLADCSTEGILFHIQRYLERKDANPQAQKVVRDAYEHVFRKRRFLSDEQLQRQLQIVGALSYSSITAAVPVEELEMWADVLETVFESEDAEPYTSPIGKKEFDRLVVSLNQVRDAYPSAVSLLRNLDKQKGLFRDVHKRKGAATPMKKVLLNDLKYKILLRGIKFLLAQKKSGQVPASWEVL